MKKLVLVLSIIAFCSISLLADITAKVVLPNLERTILNSWKTGNLEGAFTSKVLLISKVDFRLGYAENTKKGIGALSYDLKNLESLGLRITYLWDGLIKSSLGFYGGYDFSSEIVSAKDRIDYGGMLTVIAIEFK